MPNWCSATLAIYSENREQVEALFNVIETLKDNPRVKNGFGNLWLGNILDYHGICWETVRCRGCITDYEEPYGQVIQDAGGKDIEVSVLRVDTESAWDANLEMWDALLELPEYSALKYEFIAEEPGFEYFVNSDNKGWFFDDKYILDMEYMVKGTDVPYYAEAVFGYYENFEHVLKTINDEISKLMKAFEVSESSTVEIRSIEEAEEFLKKFYEDEKIQALLSDGHDKWLYDKPWDIRFHEFKPIED